MRSRNAEGNSCGQRYMPAQVVRAVVEVLAPCQGRVYDFRCGSGGMFVQGEKFIESRASLLFAYT